jgi:tetratricopeptide (TPR) repeat protein
MARGGRHVHHPQHAARGRAGRREAPPELTAEQRAELDALVAQVPATGAGLRAARSEGRAAMIARLAPVAAAGEPVAHAFARALGDLRGERARDAADIAAVLGEADPRREVAREARRSRLRLRSAGIQSDLMLPVMAPSSPPPSPPPAVPSSAAPASGERAATDATTAPETPFTPQLVEAHATRNREGGEMTLMLAWQESAGSQLVRGHLFALDFWREGAKHFILTEPMTRQQFLHETVEKLRTEKIASVPVSWAQARRLVEAALAVNAWRKREPAETFREHRAELDARLLGEPLDEEQRAAIAAEDERVAREGDRPFIASDMEADETIANWLGAWSFGDYGLSYDLLADDAPLRRAQSRAEFIATRRQWADEAEPGALRLTVVREQQRRASALWVPGAAGAVGTGKEFEAFWSLALKDSPLVGAVEEVPMATLLSQESGRHWYWTGYSMQRDRTYGLWCVVRLRDEGAASQTLTLEELQTRIEEAHQTAERAADNAPRDPRDPQAAEAIRTVTAALSTSLGYRDAVIQKLPLDEAAYRAAIDDARTLGNHERVVAYLEKMVGRFPDAERLRFEEGLEQYLVAEQYAGQGQGPAAAEWLDRAIDTFRVVVAQERTAEHLQALGEVLGRRGYMTQAEQALREAITLEPERAALHADLASVTMARAAGDNLDEPGAVRDEQTGETAARGALAELREAARLEPSLPHVFTRIGAIYGALGQQDDARLAFEEALTRDPGDADAHYALGRLFLQREEPQQALAHLETAVQLDPFSVPYRLTLAACYIALERRREATRELDLVDRLQPQLPEVAELRAILARTKK